MSLLDFADIDEQCAENKQLKREDISILEEWQCLQPHLPPPLHPIETALFLQSSSYSIEAAKRCIDQCYTFRTHCPELFANRDPFTPKLQIALNMFVITLLPELSPEGYMIVYAHLQDNNVNAFSFTTLMKMSDMIITLTLKQRGCQRGFVAIVNLRGATIAHLLKCSLVTMNKVRKYLQIIDPRILKSAHFVNGVPFMDKLMAAIKPFVGKEFKDVLHVHYGDNKTIFEFVPKHILPIECGGESFCAEEYYRNVTRKDVENYSDFFKMEESQLVDESKRPGKSHDVMDFVRKLFRRTSTG